MKAKNRYVFGAVVAAAALNVVPAFDNAREAGAAVIANFSFESATPTTVTGVNSYSYAAETGLATITIAHGTASSTAGSLSFVAGNGSARALTGNNLYGGGYTIAFSIDDYTGIALAFDMTSSATGPRDFLVTYSNDGVNYTSVGSSVVGLSGTGSTVTSGFASGTFNSLFNKSFSVPAFSDPAPGVAGDLGYLKIFFTGTTGYTSASASGGTNRIDNVVISGSPVVVPEPASAAVMTLGAAAALLRRRK